MHIRCDLYGHALEQKPLSRDHENYNVSRSSFVIINYMYIFSLCEPCHGVKKNINLTLFTTKLPPLMVRVIKFTISCVFTLSMLHTKFLKNGPVGLEKMLSHDGQRQTPPK